MRYKRYFQILILLAVIACSGSNVPSGVIPKKKMVPILVDIHLSEAMNAQKYNLSLIGDSLPEDLFLSICKKYKVERSDIEKSLLWYGKNTREYIPVYNEVLDVLSEMEVKAKNDTLKHANVGGYDLDTSKTIKTSPPPVNTDASAK